MTNVPSSTPQPNATSTTLWAMHGILTFIVGIAAILLHVWTCVIIYQTWGFKLAWPAFILPVFAEMGVLFAEWHKQHEWLNHYGMCVAGVAMGFVVCSFISLLAKQSMRGGRRRAL